MRNHLFSRSHHILYAGGRIVRRHAFMQAALVARLINRRRLCPPGLLQVLPRNLTLRHTAGSAPDLVTERQVVRVLQRTREFFVTIRDKVRGDEG